MCLGAEYDACCSVCRAKSNSQGFLSSSKEGENLSLKKVEISPSSAQNQGLTN